MKQFYGGETLFARKTIEPHQNLLSDFQKIEKECNGAIENAKTYFQNLQAQFKVSHYLKSSLYHYVNMILSI